MSTADTSKGTNAVTEITEEDLNALDTQSVVDEPLEATDPINALFLRLGTVIAVATTVLMTVLVTIAVVMRYFFNSSLPLAAEGSTYLFPWLVAGGAIVAQSQMSHVAVNVLVERLHGSHERLANLMIWGFTTLLLAYVTYLAVYMIPPMAQQSTPIMGWPQLGSFSAFIFMVAAMTVQAAVRTLTVIRTGVPHHVSTLTEGPVMETER